MLSRRLASGKHARIQAPGAMPTRASAREGMAPGACSDPIYRVREWARLLEFSGPDESGHYKHFL